MSLLDANDLAAIRAAQEEAMPDTCVVQSRTSTADGMGGVTRGDWTDGTSYSCRLSSRGVPREYLQQAAISGLQYWMVTLPHDASVTRDNRLKVGSRYLQIVGFQSGGEYETAKRAVCVEVS